MTYSWLLAGSIAGGLLLAIGLVAVREAGSWLPEPAIVAIGSAGALLAAAMAALGRTPPSMVRQVDHRWLDRFRGWVIGAGFGVQLGAGVFTRITSFALYLLGLSALAGAPATALLAAGLAYGALRGISAAPGGWVRSPRDLQRVNDLSMRFEPSAAIVARALDIVGAGTLLAALLLVAL